MKEMKKYFTGDELYGDKFSLEEIESWYRAETEAYADLGSKDISNYSYQYHNSNILNSFNHLPVGQIFENVLGLGSAYGEEFLPLSKRIGKLNILEPSDVLKSAKIGDVLPVYTKPEINGNIDFPENTFDLIVSFGTLHHIPNVAFVLSEMIRVLKPGGYMLLREPITTMGDWRKPRTGLTKNERGIPVQYFEKLFIAQNIEVVKKTFCESVFWYKILNKIVKVDPSSKIYARMDKFISKCFSWNVHYHPAMLIHKCAPGSVAYVLKKRA